MVQGGARCGVWLSQMAALRSGASGLRSILTYSGLGAERVMACMCHDDVGTWDSETRGARLGCGSTSTVL